MANSRVRRGRETQELLAARWRVKGLFPDAEAIAASLAGRDVKNTPDWAVEVKATAKNDVLAALRQAAANAADDWPVVIYRPPGYGAARIEEWVVSMNLATWEDVVRRARS